MTAPDDRVRPWFRWVPVAFYALLGWVFLLGGETAAEFRIMLVLGAVLFVWVVFADWVLRGAPQIDATRDDGEGR